jgi:hypothetical protein
MIKQPIEGWNAVTEEVATEFPDAADVAGAPRAQVRLHHLFTLTAVAAVLLALNGPQQDYWAGTEFEPPRLMVTMMTAWSVLYVLLVAVALTVVAYGIAWQRMGLTFFNHPGHWLLVEIAIAGLFGMVPTIVYRCVAASIENLDMDWFAMAVMILSGVYSLVFLLALPMGLNIYFGLKKCHETRWSLVFYLKAASKLLMGFGELLVLPFVLHAAWRDRREQTPRDSAHRCGAWLQIALSSLFIVVSIFSAVNMYMMFSRM